ncbi:MAG: XdhC family protein [Chthoniobacterales bacterium]
MSDALFEELLAARQTRKPCALVTVAETKGSVPRAAGAKMLVYGDGLTSGTIGGGKFEALAIEDALACLREKKTLLKTFPLSENEPDSFGAICGGEVTILIEPQSLREALFVFGAGHCAMAIVRLAVECGLFVTVIEDREEMLAPLPPQVSRVSRVGAAEFIAGRSWQWDEAIVIVSRNHELDREALAGALRAEGAPGYIGMIGSRRKVRQVFDRLREEGVSNEALTAVYAPIGLDIGSDSPAEIAVSALAEILAVLRGTKGGNLRERKGSSDPKARASRKVE